MTPFKVQTVQARWALPLAAAVALLDLATKAAIQRIFELGEVRPITSFFNLVYVMNPGAAFSFLASAGGWQRPFLIAVGAAISAALAFMLARRAMHPVGAAGMAAVLGGAIGNVFDRARHGAVVDWLDFYWRDSHWPALNIADIGIVMGVAALFVEGIFLQPRARRDDA